MLHRDGPLLVLAGAGSGKTRVITYRIAKLIESGVAPRRILSVTFTNKAAREMAERIQAIVGAERASELFVSTFHSFGLWVVRRFHKYLGLESHCQVMDEADRSAMIRQIRQELNLTEKDLSGDELMAFLMRVKGLGEDADEVIRSAGYVKASLLADFYRQYTERLKLAQSLDFDDLILLPVRMLSANPELRAQLQGLFDYIMVDEYQDTNILQFQFLRHLVDRRNNLCVVGDDDQSIYGWRGARVENILEFDTQFEGAKVIKLTQNYRSEQNILSIANALISNNARRKDKELWTQNRMAVPVLRVRHDSDKTESNAITHKVRAWLAEGVPPDEIAVLYRTKGQSRALQEAFRMAGVPYRVVGSFDFFDRKEIRDVMAYFRLIANPADEVSFRRVVNYPVRGIGLATLQRIEVWRRKGLPVMEAAQRFLDAERESLPPKTAKSLQQFVEMLSRANREAKEAREQDLVNLCERVLVQSGMRDDLLQREGYAWTSVQGLMGMLRKGVSERLFGTMAEFLERLSLQQNEADFSSGESKERLVTLMTVHSSKGLEFRGVILAGLVDGLFPHGRSVGEEAGIEEERRLFYVAITRAKQKLLLSYFGSREERGETHHYKPSRFLKEIPSELMEETIPDGVVSKKEAIDLFAQFEASLKPKS